MSVKNVLAVALGIMSAIGGFVDIGDLVFLAIEKQSLERTE